jgi:hypothetical protein
VVANDAGAGQPPSPTPLDGTNVSDTATADGATGAASLTISLDGGLLVTLSANTGGPTSDAQNNPVTGTAGVSVGPDFCYSAPGASSVEFLVNCSDTGDLGSRLTVSSTDNATACADYPGLGAQPVLSGSLGTFTVDSATGLACTAPNDANIHINIGVGYNNTMSGQVMITAQTH